MHVLHFIPVYAPAWQFCGPILSVSRLCESLFQHGVDVRVITTNAGLPQFPPDLLGVPQTVNGVQVTYYPVDQQGGVIRSQALVDALPDHLNWADLLHLSSIWQPLGIPIQEAAHSLGVPVIQTLRGALGPYSWSRGWWKKAPYFWLKEKPLLQRAAALHCTTTQESREIAWLGLSPTAYLLPNPMEFTQLHCSPQLGKEWRQSMGIPLQEPLLLVAGRMHHKKGLDLLPNVLLGISDRPWHIVFIGADDDGTGRRLRKKLTALALSERCHWLDHLPAHQLSAPYNAADWLMLPSRHENFGNVVIEALACGCGALVSDAVGVSDDISQCPGVYVLPRSRDSWINALRNAIKSVRPGYNSTNFVQARYDSKIVASLALQIYTKCLNSSC